MEGFKSAIIWQNGRNGNIYIIALYTTVIPMIGTCTHWLYPNGQLSSMSGINSPVTFNQYRAVIRVLKNNFQASKHPKKFNEDMIKDAWILKPKAKNV